jgi:hypothetical protein
MLRNGNGLRQKSVLPISGDLIEEFNGRRLTIDLIDGGSSDGFTIGRNFGQLVGLRPERLSNNVRRTEFGKYARFVRHTITFIFLSIGVH